MYGRASTKQFSRTTKAVYLGDEIKQIETQINNEVERKRLHNLNLKSYFTTIKEEENKNDPLMQIKNKKKLGYMADELVSIKLRSQTPLTKVLFIRNLDF